MTKRAPSRARRDDEPYRLRDLMIMFGYSDEDRFRAWRKRVEAMGFPQPLPGCTRPLKWDRQLVDEWKKVGGRPALIAQAEQKDAPPIDELAIARQRLRLKAAAHS